MSTADDGRKVFNLKEILAMDTSNFDKYIAANDGKSIKMGAASAVDAGLVLQARRLFVEVTDCHRRFREAEIQFIQMMMEADPADNFEVERLEIERQDEMLDALVAKFNQANAKVPEEVRLEIMKNERQHEEKDEKDEKDFPTLVSKLATTTTPKLLATTTTPKLATTTTTPPCWGDLQKQVLQQWVTEPVKVPKQNPMRVNFENINHDHGATNTKPCHYDSPVPQYIRHEIFECLKNGINLYCLYEEYRYDKDVCMCWKMLNEMQHRWHRKSPNPPSWYEKSGIPSCWYKHPLFRQSMNEEWCKECA